MPNIVSPLYEAIMDALVEATDQGLQEIAAAAQQKAPVRRIFQSPSKRRTLSPGDIGVRNTGAQRRRLAGFLNTSAGPAYQWPQKQGRLIFDTGSGVSRVRGSKARYISTSTTNEYGMVFAGTGRMQIGGSVRGRPNSSRPVISTKELGKIGGDLNTLSEPGQLSHEIITGFRQGHIAKVNLNDYLTARGRYELKTGRAVTTNEMGDEQIGGKLRDSIESTGAQRHGSQIYGYVKAEAIRVGADGRKFDYAWAQELGTGHNRPQPFLRPALREERERILNRERSVVQKTLNSVINRPGGRVSIRVDAKLHFKSGPTGLTGLLPLLNHMNQLARTGIE